MKVKEDIIKKEKFKNISLKESFFSSLDADYRGFEEWFEKKRDAGEEAYVARVDGNIIAFMYLKNENDVDNEITPTLSGNRLKIGTFKVDWKHHTAIGKRLLAIALRTFANSTYQSIYVTMYQRDYTTGLANLLGQYGFLEWGSKGEETVLLKQRPNNNEQDVYKNFPFINTESGNKYLLAIFPKYHQKMFGEVDLQTERHKSIEDLTSINNIEKMYFSGSSDANSLKVGDKVITYRTSDNKGPALYRSVVSSVLTVVDVRNMNDFKDEKDYHKYVKGKSVFTKSEIDTFWNNKRYPWIIKFVYNFSFEKYPNRKILLEAGIIDSSDRIVLHQITNEGFTQILKLANANENFIID